ncbi:MAG: hypothetical protein HUJ25_06165 [Crocinitomicaceae bacterium]|nr:hypothetical protein [Crocinitomicaceae bacterium]
MHKYSPGIISTGNYGEISRTRPSKSLRRWYPVADLMAGIELGNKTKPIYTAGIGFGFDLMSDKFALIVNALPYYTASSYVRDSIQAKVDIDPGANRSLTNNVFYKAQFLAAYRPNKFFTFLGGYGQNFFGEGYRSMLLSDNIGAHPFFKIETSFASIKYVNLYNFWRDNSTDPFNRSEDIPKFTSTHYLSWNITKDFNISVFETVIFQTKDTLVNRGFDFNYINPVVFYRPVEYGLGSADNVILGMNMCYKLNDHHNFYTQFVLDEFLLSEIKAQSKWWANKYGWQLGYKSDAFFKDSLFFQIEFNGARPFTYSHKSSQHAYGHMNAAAAHPLGANFMELLQITSFQKKKHRFTNKITFTTYGADPADTVSYGQDIFKPYTLRPGDFDQLLFQGIRTNVLNETFIYEYALFPKINMYLTARYNWRLVNTSLGTENFHAFTVGIRTRIWNSYSDY